MADIILVLIVAVFTYIGAKRGLIKTLFGVATTLISLVLSMMLYNPVSQIIYNSSAGDSIREFIEKIFAEKMQGGLEVLMLDQAVETAAVLVMNVLSFLLVIVAVKIIVIIIANVFNLAAKLPVIKQANKLLGMIAGALSGLLVCYIVAGVIAALGTEGNIALMQDSIKNSLLAINLYNNNLIADILSGFIK